LWTRIQITQVIFLLLLLLLVLLLLLLLLLLPADAWFAVVKAVVLVALRDIFHGEELHFDYGYDANSKHCPDWFEPVLYPPDVN